MSMSTPALLFLAVLGTFILMSNKAEEAQRQNLERCQEANPTVNCDWIVNQ